MDKNLYDQLVAIAQKRFEAIQTWIQSDANKRPVTFEKIEQNRLFFSIGSRNLVIEYIIIHKKTPEYKAILKVYDIASNPDFFGQSRMIHIEGQDWELTFFDDEDVQSFKIAQYLLGIQNRLDSI